MEILRGCDLFWKFMIILLEVGFCINMVFMVEKGMDFFKYEGFIIGDGVVCDMKLIFILLFFLVMVVISKLVIICKLSRLCNI